MLTLGETICDARTGTCKYGCTMENGGCKGETFRREYAQDHVQAMAEAIVKDAERYGIVLTIECVPLHPPAMGHYKMVVSTRPARDLARPIASIRSDE